MNIENVEQLTINITPEHAPSPFVGALLAVLRATPAPPPKTGESGVPPVPAAAAGAALAPPKIGQPWPGQGGIYAGIARGEDGQADHHLVLHTIEPAGPMNWATALEWVKTVEAEGHSDFAVPTRFESALLYANLREQFDTRPWYWTSTQHASISDYAWCQVFGYGYQDGINKSYEARVRAVRRLTA